jgi:hypothetical protein
MSKFLKLTEMVSDGKIELNVWINVSHIASFKLAKSDRDTIMAMHDGKYFFIKQKPDQIAAMLGEDVVCAASR